MSLDAIRWAQQIKANALVGNAALRTLGALALYANEARGYEAWPKIATLAADRGVWPSTIKRHLDALALAGLIVRSAGPIPPTLERLSVRHRPTVWQLQLAGFDSPQVGLSPDSPQGARGDSPQGASDDGPQPGLSYGNTEEQEGKGVRDMISEAWADIGGVTTVPDAKRYPDQCDRHQAIKSIDPCLGCKAARQARERAASAATAASRRTRGEAAARQRREAAEAILRCDMCDASGRMPGGRVCPHEESVPMPEELRELIRNGGRSR